MCGRESLRHVRCGDGLRSLKEILKSKVDMQAAHNDWMPQANTLRCSVQLTSTSSIAGFGLECIYVYTISVNGL